MLSVNDQYCPVASCLDILSDLDALENQLHASMQVCRYVSMQVQSYTSIQICNKK